MLTNKTWVRCPIQPQEEKGIAPSPYPCPPHPSTSPPVQSLALLLLSTRCQLIPVCPKQQGEKEAEICFSSCIQQQSCCSSPHALLPVTAEAGGAQLLSPKAGMEQGELLQGQHLREKHLQADNSANLIWNWQEKMNVKPSNVI